MAHANYLLRAGVSERMSGGGKENKSRAWRMGWPSIVATEGTRSMHCQPGLGIAAQRANTPKLSGRSFNLLPSVATIVATEGTRSTALPTEALGLPRGARQLPLLSRSTPQPPSVGCYNRSDRGNEVDRAANRDAGITSHRPATPTAQPFHTSTSFRRLLQKFTFPPFILIS